MAAAKLFPGIALRFKCFLNFTDQDDPELLQVLNTLQIILSLPAPYQAL